jgi:hypothetical protein
LCLSLPLVPSQLSQPRKSCCLSFLSTLLRGPPRKRCTQLARVEFGLFSNSPWTPAAAPTPSFLCCASDRGGFSRSPCRFPVLQVVPLPVLSPCEHVAGTSAFPCCARLEERDVAAMDRLLRSRVARTYHSLLVATVQRVRLVESTVFGLLTSIALASRLLLVNDRDKQAHRGKN